MHATSHYHTIDKEMIDFHPPTCLQALLEEVARFAADVERRRSGPALPEAELRHMLARLPELDLPALLVHEEGVEAEDGPLALFLFGELLGAASADLAWRGLDGLVGAVLARLAGLAPLAQAPRLFVRQGPDRWLALGHAGQGDALLFDAHAGAVYGPLDGATLARDWECTSTQGALGFPDVLVQRLTQHARAVAPPVLLGAEKTALAQRWLWAGGGVLCGVQQALFRHARAYAGTRHAFGKAIVNHQAISLRLADMALALDATRLYLLQRVAGADPTLAAPGAAGFLVDSAHALARDAVQIAGAHGYVDGLPLQRLFMQSRTLAAALAACCGDAPASDAFNSQY